MAEKGNLKDNPVAQIRERYYEQRRNRKPATEADKEAFRKDKEEQAKKNQPERKIARDSDFDHEANL